MGQWDTVGQWSNSRDEVPWDIMDTCRQYWTTLAFLSNTVGTYHNHLRFLVNLSKSIGPSLNIQSYDARVGGALLVSNTNLTISNCSFENNSAQVGGAIFSELASNIFVSNCIFLNNNAIGCSDDWCYGTGGALFIDSDCTLTAHNSIFINNTSEFGGGAIAFFQIAYTGEENTFTINRARGHGGAMYALSSSTITTDGSFFIRNEARTFGGALFVSRLSVTLLLIVACLVTMLLNMVECCGQTLTASSV